MFRAGPLVLVLIALSGSASDARGQSASNSIRGRVVAADNDRPLRRALVSLARGERGSARPILTDENGRFEIQVPDASTTIVVAKAGYASITVAPPRRPLTSPREHEVRMLRGGVISGRIVDSNGEVAIGSKVIARPDAPDARSQAFEGETDDMGVYRIGGLPPGRYVVSLDSTGPRVLTTVEVTALGAQAKPGQNLFDLLQDPVGPSRSVEVRAGEETGDIEFTVDANQTMKALAMSTMPASWGPGPSSLRVVRPELIGGRVVRLVTHDSSRNLDIVFSGGSVVTGSIVDGAGEPFQGIVVRALQVRRENGRMVAAASGWPRVTDDRGRYRLFGLSAGSYLIVASLDATEFASGSPQTSGLAPVYFPGTALVEAAQALRLESASEVTGIDIAFAASATVRVHGTVVNAAGEPMVGRVSLGVSQRSGIIAPEPRSVRTDRDGSFQLVDVPPGDYVIEVLGDATFGGPAERGWDYVSVADSDPPPLTVKTSRGTTIEGRFIVEGIADPPMSALSIQALPTDLDRSPAAGRGPDGLGVHDDGRFYLTGLFGPMRFTLGNRSARYYMKSMTIGGVDVTDGVFDFGARGDVISDAEIVLSPGGGTIAGTVMDTPTTRAPASTVVVFSTTRDRWFTGSRHVKQAPSVTNGSFDVTGLPPGEYWVAAVDALAPGDWQTGEVLDTLVGRAERIKVAEGQVSTVALRLSRR